MWTRGRKQAMFVILMCVHVCFCTFRVPVEHLERPKNVWRDRKRESPCYLGAFLQYLAPGLTPLSGLHDLTTVTNILVLFPFSSHFIPFWHNAPFLSIHLLHLIILTPLLFSHPFLSNPLPPPFHSVPYLILPW